MPGRPSAFDSEETLIERSDSAAVTGCGDPPTIRLGGVVYDAEALFYAQKGVLAERRGSGESFTGDARAFPSDLF